MKFFVVFACALAAASAGFVAPVATTVYSQAQHLPVIGANGVPVETAEVQHAKAAHFVHKAEAHARNGDFVSTFAHGSPVVSAYSSPVVAHAPVVVKTPEAYPTTYGHPGNVNGVPLETPEVVAAKTNHFAAHVEAHARNGDFVAPVVSTYAHGSPVVSAYSSPVHNVVAHTPVVAKTPEAYPTTYGHPGNVNGVPLETPEVVAAKTNHFAAHVEAQARNGDLVTKVVAPVVSTYATQTPVVSSYSVQTPVVSSGYSTHGSYVAQTPVVSAYSSPVYGAVAPVHGVVSHTPAAYPTTHVIPANINGVPLETPEVVAAKTNHFAAHSEALVRNGDAHVLYRHRRGVYTPLAYSAYNYGAFPYGYTTPVVHHY